MTSQSAISTPVAIIVAGGLVGLGLFFGLRSEPAAPPASPAVSAPVAPTGPDQTPLGPAPRPTADQPQSGPATSAAVDTKTLAAALKVALDQHKKMIVEQCLAPSLAKKPEPKTVRLTLNFSLDAKGQQVSRGISEDRETSRPDVTQCVQTKLPAITIAAPGASVFVDGVVWTLP